MILKINLAHHKYRFVELNRAGKCNLPELVLICNNSKINIFIEINAKLLKAFVHRRLMKKRLGSAVKMKKKITPVCFVSPFFYRLI